MPRYPFSPEILDAMPEELAEIFRGLELKLLEEICSRLKIADQLNEVTVQDIRALRSHGIGLDEINQAIQKTTGISKQKLDELMDDVVARNQAYYQSMVTLAQVTEPQSYIDDADIAAIRRQTWSAMKNITGSMGFLEVQGGRLTMLPPAKAYQWALDSAEMQIQSGAISYNQAIANAVRQLADSGLKTVDYESGHVDSVDVAVRRAVMTGVNQLNSKYREQSMEYLETDLVEVTAHLGARNIDGPMGWENHAEWQGKVYRWEGPRESQTDSLNILTDPIDSGRVKTHGAPRIISHGSTAPVDVTEEYKRTATPGVGEITYDDGYEHGKNQKEIKTAEWLHKMFGGDIRLLKVSETDGVKRPDYLWRNKLWELKNPSSIGAADKRLERGLKQIRENPGGVVIDMAKSVDIDKLVNQLTRRFLRNHDTNELDIMILSQGNLVKILRYKK